MKKIKKLLGVFIIFAMLLSVFAGITVSAEETVYVMNNFDNQSDAVFTNGSGWNIAACATNTPIKGGKVYIGMDWKQDTATVNARIGLQHTAAAGNDNYNILFVASEVSGTTIKVRYNTTNNTGYQGNSSIIKELTQGTWAHFDILLDFDAKTIDYYLDGSYWGTATMADRIASDGFYGLTMAAHQIIDNVVIKTIEEDEFLNLTFDNQSDAVFTNGSGWNIAACATNTPIKGGKVYIGMDWKQDTATANARIGLQHTAAAGNDNYNILFVVSEVSGTTIKVRYNTTNNTGYQGNSPIIKELTQGTWAHFDILLDFDAKTIDYYLDGSYWGTATMADRIASDGFYGLTVAAHQIVDNVVIKAMPSDFIPDVDINDGSIEIDFGLPLNSAGATMTEENVSIVACDGSGTIDVTDVTAENVQTSVASKYKLTISGSLDATKNYYLQFPENIATFNGFGLAGGKLYFSGTSTGVAVKALAENTVDGSIIANIRIDAGAAKVISADFENGVLVNAEVFDVFPGLKTVTMNNLPDKIFIWDYTFKPLQGVFELAQ